MSITATPEDDDYENFNLFRREDEWEDEDGFLDDPTRDEEDWEEEDEW